MDLKEFPERIIGRFKSIIDYSMLVDEIVNESVLLHNGALKFIKLTLEEYFAHAKFCQYEIATHN